MRNIIINIISLLFLILLPVQAASVDVGDRLPDFNLKTLFGQKVMSAKIRGDKPVLLIFWATWCQSCRNEVPELKTLFSLYQPKGVQFLAINTGISDPPSRVRSFIRKHNIRYPVALDKNQALINKFDIVAIPMIIIADRGRCEVSISHSPR